GASIDYASVVILYLYSLLKKNFSLIKIPVCGLPFEDHYRMGECIAEVINGLPGRNYAVIATGELSQGPGMGAAPHYKEFNARVLKLLQEGDFESLKSMKEDFADNSIEDIVRPALILGGALSTDKYKTNVTAYQEVDGAAYAVCDIDVESREALILAKRENEHPYVEAARDALTQYFTTGKKPVPPKKPPEGFEEKCAVFVTLSRRGEPRGCGGTLQPTAKNLYAEIMNVTMFAAQKDKNFTPVRAYELGELEYKIDIVRDLERIDDVELADGDEYGLALQYGGRRSAVMPGDPACENLQDKVRIALIKLGPFKELHKNISMYRFKLETYK
ncbi:MAG: AMMECR1 domain-containing protein, partial [Firmicutes bacterium]|nr:AMMECR1 domain-containing protein [Bacillota bacterium]